MFQCLFILLIQMTKVNSVADTKDLDIIHSTWLSIAGLTPSHVYYCNRCGSLVNKQYVKEHKDMHKFMLEMVKVLENHKNKIIEVVRAAGLPNNFT